MANQMIALGVRGPQLPNVGGRAQQYANIMANLATAREKQGQTQRAREFRDLAESGIDVTTPEGFSRLAGLDPEGAAAIRKSALEKRVADADYALKYLGTAQEELSRANTPQEAMAIGQMLKQAYPMFAGNVDEQLQTLPSDPAAFMTWRENTTLSAMKSAERMKYFRDEVKTEMVTSETGDPLVATYGGLGTPTLKTPRSLVLAPRTGQVNVEPSVPVDDGMGGPDTNAIADLAGGIVSAENDRDYQAALAILDRQAPDMAAQVRSAMPRFDPARIQSIRAALQEEMGVGAAPLVEGARGGVGGPDEGYVEAPRPFRLKNPMQSPMPGSAQVPISRVRAEAQAERETPDEIYRKEMAREQARIDAAAKAPPKKLTPVQEAKLRDNIAKDYKSARSTIEMMDGVTRAVNDVRNLSRDQKEAITGLSGYIYSIRPSSRSADTKLKNLQGKVTEMGKAAASLTGAIGQMAVQEWRIVSDMIASLDVTGMEPSDLDDQLDIIEGQARRAASITRDAYENQYAEEFARYPGRFTLPSGGGAAPAKRSGAAKIPTLTPEQARRAPKGTRYRTTDGRILER